MYLTIQTTERTCRVELFIEWYTLQHKTWRRIQFNLLLETKFENSNWPLLDSNLHLGKSYLVICNTMRPQFAIVAAICVTSDQIFTLVTVENITICEISITNFFYIYEHISFLPCYLFRELSKMLFLAVCCLHLYVLLPFCSKEAQIQSG